LLKVLDDRRAVNKADVSGGSAQECSDGYYCQPPRQSDTGKRPNQKNSALLEVDKKVTVAPLTLGGLDPRTARSLD
jgi:hypothetical protein